MIELDVLHPSESQRVSSEDGTAESPRTWRSYADHDDAAGYAARRRDEFHPDAFGEDDGSSRRSFLKVMGASMAFAGLAGCRRPVEETLPYVRKPQDVTPGIANYYATAMPLGGVLHGLVVESHEGRPTKVEGNPQHPVSKGKSDGFAQASILNLYDPDRSRRVMRRRDGVVSATNWQEFVRNLPRLKESIGGRPIAVLASPSNSLTRRRLREQLEETNEVTWLTLHENGDDAEALGTQAMAGRTVRPLYRFSEANVIVSFDADFLGSEDINEVWNNREYAESRRIEQRGGEMSRHYAVESGMTLTGGSADHRLRMKAGAVPFFAAAVAEALGEDISGAASVEWTEAQTDVLEAIVDDVRASNGRAAFVAGATQPPEVHALCAALNGRFGSQIVTYLDPSEDQAEPVGTQFRELVQRIEAGEIGMLIALDSNPVYALSDELRFEEALANVPVTIHAGAHRDETGRAVDWHLPLAHYLESWGDGRSYDGTLSVTQPLIAPLYNDAHSDVEILNVLSTGAEVSGYELVRETMRGRLSGENFETAWRTALHDGFVPGTQYPQTSISGGPVDFSGLRPPPADAVEVVLRSSPAVRAGRFSNNAWSLETPDPVTKLTWDNVALMSRETAETLGVRVKESKGKHYADRISIRAEGRDPVDLPVWIQPGHPDRSITVYLGYGREIETEREIRERPLLGRLVNHYDGVYRPGPVGNGVGSRVEGLRSLTAQAVVEGVTVETSGEEHLLATTQDHGNMEGREIVRWATAEEFKARPDFAKLAEKYIEDVPWDAFPPLWGGEKSAGETPKLTEAMYSDQQWGMTIDLNVCNGCNACVTACQSENNVQVVGKDQVARGREMHWLRIDRYYVGDPSDDDNVGMVVQAMPCQHCENAPCEQVCPVNATSHSPDGINEMTYNRCIGTRYCANNCPYKVRRFNFFNWSKMMPQEVQMQQNPDVTVRFRGVMEKCTYCVHRIRKVNQYNHINDRPYKDGEIQTACQQACPSDAIVFGNIADAESRVSREKANPRNYDLLAELAVKPRTSYLARLRNPHPRLTSPFDAEEPQDSHGGSAHG